MTKQPPGLPEQDLAGSGIDAMAEQRWADVERAETQRLGEDRTQKLAAVGALEEKNTEAEAERKGLERNARLRRETERAAEAERLKEEVRIQQLAATEALEKEEADAEAERRRLEESYHLGQGPERAAEAEAERVVLAEKAYPEQEAVSAEAGHQRLTKQSRLEQETVEAAEAERLKEETRIQQLAAAEVLEKNTESERKRMEEKAYLEQAAEAEAQRKRREEELCLEKEAEQAAELKRLLAAEMVERERAAERERFTEAERQRLAAMRRKEEEAATAAKALDEQRAAELERAAVMEAARQIFVREQAALIDKKLQELDLQRQLASDEQIRLSKEIQGETVRIEDMREEEDDPHQATAANEHLTDMEEWGGQSDVETGSMVTALDRVDDSTSEAFETAAESEDELDYSDEWGAETEYIASGYETPRALEISPPEPIEVSDATLADAVRHGSRATNERPESFEGAAEYGSHRSVNEDISLSLLLPEKLLPSPPTRQDTEVNPDKNSPSSEESAPMFGQPSSPPSSVDLTPVDTPPWPSPPPEVDGGVLLNDAIAGLAQDKPSLSLPSAPEEVSETSSDMDSSGGGESEQEPGRIPTSIVESAVFADTTQPEIEAMESVLENSEAGQLAQSSPATPAKGLEDITGLFALRSPESPAQGAYQPNPV